SMADQQAASTPLGPWRLPPLGLTAGIVLYALAMAYLESAVVVYLRAALGVPTGTIFPIDLSPAAMPFGWIEVGREAATLVMIGAVAWNAGRSPLERLAWAGVVFGIWDIGYYAWLWVFSGWPPSVGTWDLLFLLPAPWAGPVWAPIAVSAGLIGFGLACAGRLRSGGSVRFGRRHLGALLLGGAIVIASFLTNAGLVLGGGIPTSFAWPIFAVGMGIGMVAAWMALRSGALTRD
ncbi:MAG: hypothetical protein ABIS42_00040, partial [Candidatus Limnocylindria bacterium]